MRERHPESYSHIFRVNLFPTYGGLTGFDDGGLPEFGQIDIRYSYKMFARGDASLNITQLLTMGVVVAKGLT